MEPETMRGVPLCMNQYSRMFSTCRVPGEEVDNLEQYDNTSKHIAVLANNAIFLMDVVDDKRNPLPAGVLVRCVQ